MGPGWACKVPLPLPLYPPCLCTYPRTVLRVKRYLDHHACTRHACTRCLYAPPNRSWLAFVERDGTVTCSRRAQTLPRHDARPPRASSTSCCVARFGNLARINRRSQPALRSSTLCRYRVQRHGAVRLEAVVMASLDGDPWASSISSNAIHALVPL